MSRQIKGITIEIGGNTQKLTKALEDVNKKSRDIQGELREVDRLLKLDPKNTELLAQKQKLLTDAISNTSDKLKTLKEAERQVQKQFKKGEVGEEQYRAIQREVIKTEQNLKSLEDSLKATNNKWKDLSNNLNKAGTKMKDIGGSFTTKVTAPIVGGSIAVVEGTREFREELARLENNAQLAGASIDITKEAFRDLNAITGETDSNVEALSNLLQAGFKDDSLTQVVNELSGAVLKFPDTLKIEGLADGLQETLATGQAIGPFAELLERMGVDLEVFNEGLSKASEKGEEQNYVLQQLSELGLAKVNEAYRENNKELIQNAEAQNRLKEATAELAAKLEPILTSIKEVLARVLEQFLALSPAMQKVIGGLAALAAAIGPILMIVGQIATGLSSIIGLFSGTATAVAGATTATSGLGAVLSALTGPIGIVIAAIAAIVAIIVRLWKTNEEFRENVKAIWEQIKEIFNLALNRIQEIVTIIYNAILSFWKQNGEQIKNITSAIWNAIAGIINGVMKIIKGILDVFIGLITGDWERFGNGLKKIWQGLWDGIKAIVESTRNIIQNIVEIFINLISQKWEGFGNTLKMIWETLWNIIQTVVDSGLTIIKGLIDIFTGIVTGDWEKFTEGLQKIWQGLWDGVKAIVDGAWSLLSGAFSKLWNSISGWFSDLVSSAFNWGKNMIDGFIDGIKSMVNNVKNAVTSVIDTAKSYIGFNSPAEKGPGRYITVWGQNMIEGFLDGVKKAMPELEKTMSAVIPDLSTSTSNNTTYISSGPSITVVNRGTIVGRNGMDEFAEVVGRTISRKYGLSTGGAY